MALSSLKLKLAWEFSKPFCGRTLRFQNAVGIKRIWVRICANELCLLMVCDTCEYNKSLWTVYHSFRGIKTGLEYLQNIHFIQRPSRTFQSISLTRKVDIIKVTEMVWSLRARSPNVTNMSRFQSLFILWYGNSAIPGFFRSR